jgi:hypothetical protein
MKIEMERKRIGYRVKESACKLFVTSRWLRYAILVRESSSRDTLMCRSIRLEDYILVERISYSLA